MPLSGSYSGINQIMTLWDENQRKENVDWDIRLRLKDTRVNIALINSFHMPPLFNAPNETLSKPHYLIKIERFANANMIKYL